MYQKCRSKNVVIIVLLSVVCLILAGCAGQNAEVLIPKPPLSASPEEQQAANFCFNDVNKWRVQHGKTPMKQVSMTQMMHSASPFSLGNLAKIGGTSGLIMGATVANPIFGLFAPLAIPAINKSTMQRQEDIEEAHGQYQKCMNETIMQLSQRKMQQNMPGFQNHVSSVE